MMNQLLLISAVVFFTTFSQSAWSLSNPTARRPVGSAPVVPSSVRSGLFRSPNPINTSGNLVITGNVSRGRHFRGIVPYRIGSSFTGSLGSTSLDSFFRDSAGAENFGHYSGKSRPFYSPSGTVTTTKPGRSGVVRLPTTKIVGRLGGERLDSGTVGRLDDSVVGVPVVSPSESLPDLTFYRPTIPSTRRPMSRTLQQLEKRISRELGIPYEPQRGKMTAQERQAQMEETTSVLKEDVKEDFSKDSRRLAEPPVRTDSYFVKESKMGPGSEYEKFRRQLKQVSDKAAELKQVLTEENLTEKGDSLLLSTKPQSAEELRQQLEIARRKELTSETADFEQSGIAKQVQIGRQAQKMELRKHPLDVYEQMKQQLGMTKRLDDRTARRLEGEEIVKRLDGGRVKWEAFQPSDSRAVQLSSRQTIEPSQADKLSEVTLSVGRAKAILGSHKTFASFSDDKFNQYIRAGEEYLNQGQYYRAADAYTLASVYKPDDPLSYAGKSHALFAAGEYMSSSLFLTRALELFPEYALFKIDLVSMVGDRDKLESRTADVEQWLEKNDACELQFLLGYIYYQMGRFERAKKVIDAAYEKMPDSPAVAAVKKAIEANR